MMSENLSEWLAAYRVKNGALFDKDPRKRIVKIVRLSDVTWKRNALRHSFGSYRMEQTKNEGQVAREMGNSPKVAKDIECAYMHVSELTPLCLVTFTQTSFGASAETTP